MKAIQPLLCVVALLAARPAAALIMVSEGNQPVQDFGWAKGALEVANLKTRIGYWEGPPFGGGEYHFIYRGDNEAANIAVKAFAAIHAEKLEIILHDGLGHDQFLAKDAPVDWSFTVWVPTSWDNLYNNPKVTFNTNDSNYGKPLPPPRMNVYVGAGGLDWSKVTVPPNVHVRDGRESKDKRPYDFQSYRDADSGIIFYVESDLHHIVALDKDGRILWCRQPALDGNLPPYSEERPMKNPAIVWLGGLTAKDQERLKKTGSGKFIGISFGSRQAGALDVKNGDFVFEGQD